MPSRILLLSVNGAAATQIEQALAQRGNLVSALGDPATAMKRLGEHDMVILDAVDDAAVILLCRRINDEIGRLHPPILAIAHSPDVDARVRLLESGADDVLALPVDERELEALVEALLLRSPVGPRPATQSIAAPTPSGSTPGRLIGFASAKGGSGTTTLAVNTALLLAEMAPGSVALVDLDMYHGQIATHLDIYAGISTAELAGDSDGGPTPEALHQGGRLHSSGLTVFGGPYRVDDAYDVTGEQLVALVDALRGAYATVVVDAGSTFDRRTLTMLDRADRLALVVTPDIPSLRLLHSALQVLSENGAAIVERTVFVVNQVYPRPTIGTEQIEEHLGIKVQALIPYEGDAFLKAANEGQPLVLSARRSTPAQAVKRLSEMLSEGSLDEPEARPQQRGRLRGLLGRN